MKWHSKLGDKVILVCVIVLLIICINVFNHDINIIKSGGDTSSLWLKTLVASMRDGIIMGGVAGAILGGAGSAVRGSFVWGIVNSMVVGLRFFF